MLKEERQRRKRQYLEKQRKENIEGDFRYKVKQITKKNCYQLRIQQVPLKQFDIGKKSTLNMNSPLAQQYSSLKENTSQQQQPYMSKNNAVGYSTNNSIQNSTSNAQNRISSIVGLKQIINPGQIIQNSHKVQSGNNSFEPKGANMNFSQGHIHNSSNSQQQQQPQLSNHQRSFSNSKLLQQKYVSSSNKSNSIYNSSNLNSNMNSSDYIFASNYSSNNTNNINSFNTNPILPNSQIDDPLNNQANHGINNYNNYMSNTYNSSNVNNEIALASGNAKNSSPPKNGQTAASNTAFNLFKNNYLKPTSNVNTNNGSNLPINNQNSNNYNYSNYNSTSSSTNANSNINSTSSKNIQANNSLQSSQQNQQPNSGKTSLNVKKQTYSNQTSTPKQITSPIGQQAQYNSYTGLDKQSHLQSIEKIKEDINKKLILQQQISTQIGNSNQNSNGSKSSTPNGLSNKMSSSNSEHKNNSTAATNNMQISINQSTSVSRKVSNGTVGNQNSINNFMNSNSNNNVNIDSSKSSSNVNRMTSAINSGCESNSLNATGTNLPQNVGSNSNNFQYNSNNSASQINGNNNSFTNLKGGVEDNSSTNIIFEKVKKRKMNNLSIGNQYSPHQISISQPQSHLSSTKNLQYIIQNKSPTNKPQNANSSTGSGHNLNQKGLSKTMSFSGHQNNFYSTNSYIKSPQLNLHSSGVTNAANSFQNQSNTLNQSAKIKNKKVSSNHDMQISQNAQLIGALVNNINTATAPNSIVSSMSTGYANPQLSKINFSQDGSSLGNNPNHIKNSSSGNLSPKPNKENVFMDSALTSTQQNSGLGIGNLNTMNGTSLQIKDQKQFFKNTTQQYTNNGKGSLQQWNVQSTNTTTQNQTTNPTQQGQNTQNQKSLDIIASRQSNQYQSGQSQQPAQNQSLNSSHIKSPTQQNKQSFQLGAGNLNSSFLSSQQVNSKIIMNKLENFDVQLISNPFDHISEITSLLLISLQDSPFSDVLKKFEENIQQISQNNKSNQKQIQQQLQTKLKEVDILQQDLNILQIKLDQKEKEASKSTNSIGVGFNKKIDQQTQTSVKRKQLNDKNSLIQICDQNGNVQEVDTDKENEMLKDYILEQEKKVNELKEKEAKMIKLILAIKKRGLDIDDIYNHEVINDDSNDEIQKNAPLSTAFPVKKKKNKIDAEFFKRLDNEQGYADNSIVNDSDESSFGFYGKPSDRDQIKQQKPKLNKIQSAQKIPQKLQDKFKLNLQNIMKQESEEDDDDEQNKQFHQKILNTLQITQEQLDQLQQQIQKDPNNLSPQQYNLIQQIHQIQQQHEKQLQETQNGQQNVLNHNIQPQFFINNEQILNFDQDSQYTDQSQMEGMHNNILPSDLKKQLTTISRQTDDGIQVLDEQQLNAEEEFAKYFVQK